MIFSGNSRSTISVLSLIYPGLSSPDQTPVILGTNANLFKRLAQLCKDKAGVDIAQTLGIAVNTALEDLSLNTVKITSECATAEDHVGSHLGGPRFSEFTC